MTGSDDMSLTKIILLLGIVLLIMSVIFIIGAMRLSSKISRREEYEDFMYKMSQNDSHGHKCCK